MNHWLVKCDPDDYSARDLERDGRTAWDGVHNPVALRHLRSMTSGDLLLIYHTGKEKAIVATGQVASTPRDDPNDAGSAIVDLAFSGWLKRPVTLAEVKSDPFFADFALVRQARLSVMPVTAAQWQRLLAMADAAGPARK
jgi:predicted RNA-binding protein with PUA-like domain